MVISVFSHNGIHDDEKNPKGGVGSLTGHNTKINHINVLF